ncbi:hypothetical protein ANN_00352 [Periplaneta americana]|uniref:Uncharacterized protein n=1 Tax=Periplaneta americana TaxID=6978 RepID=A0ABQ8TQL4_PERAM|nr:hypothetical protein ANN_00352 [Periplaneta americana]
MFTAGVSSHPIPIQSGRMPRVGRRVFRSQARSVIYNAIKFCDEEKKTGLFLSLSKTTERAAAILKLNKETISRIRKEGNKCEDKGVEISTPNKVRRPPVNKVELDDMDKCIIRREVHKYYGLYKELSALVNRSHARVVDEFRRNYPDVSVPNNSTITRLIARFMECGSALLDSDERDCCFQQDSVTCHTSNKTMQFLLEFYGDNAGEMSPGSSTESYPAFARIGLRENPGKNLNQGFVKDIIYSKKSRNIDDLRVKITQAFQQITPLMLQRTGAELHQSYELCRVRNGGHVEL